MTYKYKSMVSLTVSYIPWVIYWTLSAMKVKYGTSSMFLITLIYLAFERYKKDISLMDVVAAMYSFLAVTITYGLNTSLFIDGDGYLGYGTLFLMGILSRKTHPFMQYYIEKDFNTSKKIDGLIQFVTNLWTVTFGINTLIFLCINQPVVAVVASNVVVLFSSSLSIYMSTKKAEEMQ